MTSKPSVNPPLSARRFPDFVFTMMNLSLHVMNKASNGGSSPRAACRTRLANRMDALSPTFKTPPEASSLTLVVANSSLLSLPNCTWYIRIISPIWSCPKTISRRPSK